MLQPVSLFYKLFVTHTHLLKAYGTYNASILKTATQGCSFRIFYWDIQDQ